MSVARMRSLPIAGQQLLQHRKAIVYGSSPVEQAALQISMRVSTKAEARVPAGTRNGRARAGNRCDWWPARRSCRSALLRWNPPALPVVFPERTAVRFRILRPSRAETSSSLPRADPARISRRPVAGSLELRRGQRFYGPGLLRLACRASLIASVPCRDLHVENQPPGRPPGWRHRPCQAYFGRSRPGP